MKILSVNQIREADKYTIENEPIESVDLMERAATKVFEWLYRRAPREKTIKIFCGMGNNGGDGLVVARLLNEQEIVPQVFMVRYSDRMSHDCEVNYYRLVNETKVPMFDILTEDDFPKVDANDVVVDALFGSGLNRPPQGMTADLIAYLNQSKAIRVAIDIPSGLFADQPSALGFIFKADYTLTFQNPKLAFLLPENDPYPALSGRGGDQQPADRQGDGEADTAQPHEILPQRYLRSRPADCRLRRQDGRGFVGR